MVYEGVCFPVEIDGEFVMVSIPDRSGGGGFCSGTRHPQIPLSKALDVECDVEIATHAASIRRRGRVMARIRTIKPEFFTSEDIVSLSPLARLFYVSLWCEADREGRLDWRIGSSRPRPQSRHIKAYSM